VLEHLPFNKREQAIKEIIRVANLITIIGVPCGRKSLDVDRKLARLYRDKNISIPSWLEDHLKYQYPTFNQLVKILDKEGYPYKVFDNENVRFHYWIMYLEDTTRYARKIFDLIIHRQRRLAETIVSFLNFGSSYRKIFVVTKR
jgi:hypothetical protein